MQPGTKLEPSVAELTTGSVAAVEVADHGYRFAVQTARGCTLAPRAASCLLLPQPGDRVLLSRGAGGAFVLAVLERDASEPARLVVDGDAQVSARGKLTLSGEAGVSLLTDQVLSLASRAFELHSGTGHVVLGGLKTIVGTVDALLERLSQRVKRAYRVVEDMDHLRAGGIDYAARESVRVHGRNALMTALELVKVNGEQIHMG